MEVNIEFNDVINEYSTQLERLHRENALIKAENIALKRLLDNHGTNNNDQLNED